MNRNLKLVINNGNKKIEDNYFFEKNELKNLLNNVNWKNLQK